MRKLLALTIIVLALISAFLLISASTQKALLISLSEPAIDNCTGCSTIAQCLACLDKKIIESLKSESATENLEVEEYVVKITYNLTITVNNAEQKQVGETEYSNLKQTWENSANQIQVENPYQKTDSKQEQIAAEIFQLINNKRRSYGLAIFSENTTLKDFAQRQSDWMVQTGSFAHSSTYPAGFSRWAENIAYVPKDYSAAKVAVINWMNSTGHRANILGQYSKTGIGVSCTQSYSVNYCYITQQFGS